MEEEFTLLKSSLGEPRSEAIGLFQYYCGYIEGIEVVLFQCGIGKVNAAVGTTLLIDKFKPDYLVNTGVAGGLTEQLEIGDVVISSKVRHYDADATAFEYEAGQIPQMPPAYRSDDLLSRLACKVAACFEDIAVHHGTVLSGDSFIHTPQQVSYIFKRFPGAMAVEMEGAAVAQTTYLFDIPFILIRSISDKVCAPNNEKVYAKQLQEAANNSTKIVLGLIDELWSTQWKQ